MGSRGQGLCLQRVGAGWNRDPRAGLCRPHALARPGDPRPRGCGSCEAAPASAVGRGRRGSEPGPRACIRSEGWARRGQLMPGLLKAQRTWVRETCGPGICPSLAAGASSAPSAAGLRPQALGSARPGSSRVCKEPDHSCGLKLAIPLSACLAVLSGIYSCGGDSQHKALKLKGPETEASTQPQILSMKKPSP